MLSFDLISIFPEYFDSLRLSLLGKAQDSGTVALNVHNLRDWATGKHLSVDDTPAGGGAGMVMKPDVWGDAIRAVRDSPERPRQSAARVVLAIPTPSGIPLTQSMLENLSTTDQIIVACGRYEGIDSRVARHFETADLGIEVLEFSLGDYVLNGGEVAALALVEGVARLVDGFMGNPESLVEESHSDAGLLEYPVYTRPREWQGLEVPEVLFSGDHTKIARWRRDRAIEKTVERRPDMTESFSLRDDLTKADLEVLAKHGILVRPRRGAVSYRVIDSLGDESTLSQDLVLVSDLASRTFPLACPPDTAPEEIERFVANNLSPESIGEMVRDGARICVAEVQGQMVAYTLMEPEPPSEIAASISARAAYLSKCYTDPEWHGSGLSGAILRFALDDARSAWNPDAVVLGTNRGNKRAAKFYRAHGFAKSGHRAFNVGGRDHQDDVFVLDLTCD